MSTSQIKYLPKEALFNLLLQLEPREMKIVCGSLNRKVREICKGDLFKKAYHDKYDLLKGKFIKEYGENEVILTDELGNKIQIFYGETDTDIQAIEFTPFKQIYPSTFRKNYNEYELRKSNPLTIVMSADNKLYIGRDFMSEVLTIEDENRFLNNYNKEVKEFLQYINREYWWKPDINFGDNIICERHREEFKKEVIDLLNKN